MANHRIQVHTGAWAELKAYAQEVGLVPKAVLSYLLGEVARDSVGSHNADIVRKLDSELTKDSLSAAPVDTRGFDAIRTIAHQVGASHQAVATYVINDNLPVMRAMPETYPGLGLLPRRRSTKKQQQRRLQAGLARPVYDALVRRLKLTGTDDTDRVTVVARVEAILDSLPSNFFMEAIDMKRFGAASAQWSGSTWAPVRLSANHYALLRDLKALSGQSMSSILTCIIDEELRSTEKELTTDGRLLPDDLRERWTAILRGFLQTSMRGDGRS